MNVGGWLFSEAGAGWVFGIISAVGWAIAYRSKRRPPKIVVREVFHGSLVRVRDDIRPAVEVRLWGEAVSDVDHVVVELTNSGNATVNDALIHLRFDEDTKLVDAGHDEEAEVPRCTLVTRDNQLSVTVPYLNPLKEHGHRLTISMLVTGPGRLLSVVGAGSGWSSQLVAEPDPDAITRKVRWAAGGTLGWLVLYAFIIAPAAMELFNISKSDPSWGGVALLLLGLTPSVFGIGYMMGALKRLIAWRR